jgi:GrpB-like predicted nucleotidyltransferase (UPF0157 family)
MASTAVPGLSAKPIIDIALVANLASGFECINELLLANGYRYLRNAGDDGGSEVSRRPGRLYECQGGFRRAGARRRAQLALLSRVGVRPDARR